MTDGVVTIRASSFAGLFDCAYKWQATHLLGMRMPHSPRAHLGTAIHAATAVFDQGRIEQIEGTEPLVTAYDAGQAFMEAFNLPEYDVDWRNSDIGRREAEAIGLTLVNRYCNEISPRFTFVSIEMDTTPLVIDCGNGITIRLTGTLDRARIIQGSSGLGIADVKTGKTASKDGLAKTAGHKAQLGAYELLFEHTTGCQITEPSEIIGLCTGSKLDVGTGQIHGAKQLLLGDDDNPGYIQLAAEIFRTGLFTPNPQSSLCSVRFCPRWNSCIYHD